MRYELVEFESASDEVRDIYREIQNTLGTDSLPNWVKAMGSNASLLRANWEKTKGVLVNGNVPRLLKELIIFSVSTHNGAAYCKACHAHAALSLDHSLTIQDLEAIVRGEDLEALPQSYRVALDVVVKAAVTPHEVTDGDFQKLRDSGFSEQEVGELLAQGDLALMFNAITSAYSLEIDDEYKKYVIAA